ncbi:MAG: bifunctional 4-hydroxy-2-oxoglutarate aldolase/2-dehydro-3-deoxy-phosphogluconate aldolase [Bacteroidetes bacterium]|nr:bifunctional 4-hydroxy-2-oxoglutarate aldolase/2-dehydro-3-deoxy-phosphogluconate aldolase [Bacteroidota bacterium]MBU1680105.1 bifunctional 4-hydroxy-2-oxoglutarate aldolase/2-dehydro-3-deoxy-phosphogluconate aldolase [Bacteroidota bacterium]MBU2506781.1 bifunctional 4-hydroxy-2-oxoglutarate aldolase/2-dehydro-3-deoxy-phosphogluconate aldolase [Bacteroidota bacterium]
MNKDQITKRIIENCAVAVIRVKDQNKLLKVVEAIYKGGVKGIEITMTVPNAIQQVELVTKEFSEDMIVGVGSVLDSITAEQAIDAGAKYVVSPIFKKEIINTAHNLNVPAMPGCFTPTEIQTAHELGADIIKVFPADVLGMAFFKGIKAPMPHLKLMPTGGVTLENAGEWLNAGACAVGIGSALLDNEAIESGNYNVLTENAQKLMANIESKRTVNNILI